MTRRHAPSAELELRRLCAVGVAAAVSTGLTASSVPLALDRVGYSPALAGLSVTVMLGATTVTQPFVPRLIARSGHSTIQLLGVLLLCAITPLYLVQNLAVIYLVSALRGAGLAMLVVAGVILATAAVEPLRRRRAASIYGVATTLPATVALPCGIALTSAGHFAWVAWVSSATVLAVLPAARLGGARTDADQRPAGSGRPPCRMLIRAVGPAAAAMLAVAIAVGGLTTYLPIAHPSGIAATVALLLYGLGVAAARWRTGHLPRLVSDRTWLALSCALAALGIVVAGLTTSATGTSIIVLIVACGVFGLAAGSVQSLTMVDIMSQAPERLAGAASAVWNLAIDAGAGLGALFVGEVSRSELHISDGIALTSAFIVLAVLGLARTPRTAGRAVGTP